MPPSTQGFAHVNGASLYYETAGEGRPVVFVHAGLADSGMWDGQFEAFAAHYRAIRYDIRGFGQSVPVKGKYSHAEDLEGLLQHLGVTRPASSAARKAAASFSISRWPIGPPRLPSCSSAPAPWASSWTCPPRPSLPTSRPRS